MSVNKQKNRDMENIHAFLATPSDDGKKITIDLAAREGDFPFPELKSGKSSIVLALEVGGTDVEGEFCMTIQHGYCYLYLASKKDERLQLALYPLHPSLNDGVYSVTKLD